MNRVLADATRVLSKLLRKVFSIDGISGYLVLWIKRVVSRFISTKMTYRLSINPIKFNKK